MSINPTKATTKSIDLPYEIKHMRAAYRLLPIYGAQDDQLRNLIIEAFWLHARNLIELFLRKKNSAHSLFLAGSAHTPLDSGKLKRFYRRICTQITHLKTGRPVSGPGKLDCRDPDFIAFIEKEIAQFRLHVRPDVLAHLGPDKIGDPMIPELRRMGPSGQTGTMTTTTTIPFGCTGPGGPSR